MEKGTEKVSPEWFLGEKKWDCYWLIYFALLQQSLHVPWTSMCVPVEVVCQPACGVMDMITVWMAQMRSVLFQTIQKSNNKTVRLSSGAASQSTVPQCRYEELRVRPWINPEWNRNHSVFWFSLIVADNISRSGIFDDSQCVFADRLAAWRSAEKMSSSVWTALTVSLDAGAAMMCWTAWTTVMRRIVARVCPGVWPHLMSALGVWSLKLKSDFNVPSTNIITGQRNSVNSYKAFFIKGPNKRE